MKMLKSFRDGFFEGLDGVAWILGGIISFVLVFGGLALVGWLLTWMWFV